MSRLLAWFALAGCLTVGAYAADDAPPMPDVFRLADADKDGKISRAEFLKATANNPLLKGNPALAGIVFDRADADKSGSLSPAELRALAESTAKDKKPAPVKKGEPAAPPMPATAEGLAFFEKKIRPVLVQNCQSCHAGEKLKGGLALDTREGIRRGGDTGPAVVPGNPKESLLLQAIRYADESCQMPPKGKLADTVVADFDQWIKMGAPDPRDGKLVADAKAIDIEKGRQFWSFQPPRKPQLPAVADATWAKSDIDRLVLAALEQKKLRPVADADKATLLRRVHFDLTGLPPSPEEVSAFLIDDSPAAFERVVDKLLESPRFGERWGRHWLDVARFGESSGRAANVAYPHAWRYRDYVINAFNTDKPYDAFIREQIAGDLLPSKDDKEKAERIIATGFLAIGPKNHNERNRTQFQLDVIDEQIDATTQGILGMTVSCARCHDHKFDPIPQKDYYSLAGIFRSTETLYGTVRAIQNAHATELIELPKGQYVSVSDPLTPEQRKSYESTIADLKKQRDALEPKDRFLSMSAIRINTQLGLTQSKLDAFAADGTPRGQAMGVRESRRVADSPLYVRGEPAKPEGSVPRGVPQVMTKKQLSIRSGSGRRELADWMASEANPLTSRVWVNRVWGHLFGRGIVPTPDNFGSTGTPPTNPALLDYLAVTFAGEQKWSTKKLVRSMVLSHAYRLGSKFDEKNHLADPENALVWRMTPSRLEAEAVRDAMLAVSDRLSLAVPTGSAVAKSGDGPTQLLQFTMRGLDQNDNHRTVYYPIVRDQLPEVLTLFDFPDPSVVTGERPTTTVPAQSLFLMNNPFVIRCAESSAERVYNLGASDSQRIDAAYRLFYSRTPTPDESKAAKAFLEGYSRSQGKGGLTGGRAQRAAWIAFAQALFGSAEFLYRN